MGSLWGFRCERCRAEVVARPEPGPLTDRRAWTPPILCCGQPLSAIDPDQLPLFMPSRRRGARCPRCGYQVGIVVHFSAPLVCMVCQADFVMIRGRVDRDDRATTPVMPTSDFR